MLLIGCFVVFDREVKSADWSGLGFRGVYDSICGCAKY